MKDIEICTKALRLRKELGVDATSPVDILALASGIPYLTLVFYPLGERISGMCVKNGNTPLVAINSSMSLGRQRFSMAHEFYHLFYDEHRRKTVSFKEIGSGSPIEKSADRFASYFLMPPVALDEALQIVQGSDTTCLKLEQIIHLEQHFGVSRQALLYRLVGDKKLTLSEANGFKQGVIRSAVRLGYDDALYKPRPSRHKHDGTYGYYIRLAEDLLNRELISEGKHRELLLDAFRSDLAYGEEHEEDELND